MTEYIDNGFGVLEIQYQPPVQETALGRLLQPASTTNTVNSKNNKNVAELAIQWLVRISANAIRSELSDGLTSTTNVPIQERYRAQDDSADRVRSQD